VTKVLHDTAGDADALRLSIQSGAPVYFWCVDPDQPDANAVSVRDNIDRVPVDDTRDQR